MKKRILALALFLAVLLSLVPAVFAADAQPVPSSNKNKQDYTTYGSTVKSYLYENKSGGLTRVEYISGKVVVEDYDSSFRLQSSRQITPELPIWGGFYAGQDYNFLFFGQNNPSESDSVEVIRAVKYDKDWNRLGQTSIKGANTTKPFDAGSLRCGEYGGYLYVRTCHAMYKDEGGINHQSNVMLQIKQSDMTLSDAFYDVWCVDWGYISHSFNQFILIDQDQNIIGFDHSDSNSLTMGANWSTQSAATRGAVLVRYDLAKAGSPKFTNQRAQKWCSFSLVQSFSGYDGNNVTGASLGGLTETSTGYVSAYNYNGTGASGGDRSVYLGFTAKSGLKSSAARVSTSGNAATPVLVSTGLSGGYVMWNGKDGYTVNDTLYYAAYDDGGRAGQVKTAAGSLSDCQPIQYNGRVVWYVTDNSAPVFYTLDASGVKQYAAGDSSAKDPDPEITKDPAPEITKDPDPEVTGTPSPDVPVFTDVPAGHWAYSYIYECARKGIVKGVDENRFSPNGYVTCAEFCTMLARAFYPDELASWEKQANGKPWYWAAMSAVYSSGKGLSPTVNPAASFQKDWTDAANVHLSRYEMTRIMYQLLPWSSDSLNTYSSSAAAKLSDWGQLTESYRQPVAVCVFYGVITGVEGDRFAGTLPMTRAQACTVLIRLDSAGASAEFANRPVQPAEHPSISITPASLTLAEGETGAVKAVVTGVAAPAITYSSSSQSVASVSSNGTVTANSAGTAVITASITYLGGTYTASCAVTVTPVAKPDPEPDAVPNAGELYLPHSMQVLTKGSELLFTAYEIQPDGSLGRTNGEVTWTCETPDLATLRKSGTDTVASFRNLTGTARFTASYKGQTKQFAVKLVEQEDVINLSSPWIGGIRAGETFSTQLYVFSTSKFYGKDYAVSWSLNDPSLGTITETMVNGKHAMHFTAQKAGMAQITCLVTLPDGSSAAAYCDIYIY